MELPKEFVNVLLTYEGNIYVPDKYYGRYEKGIVTRRAFYANSQGYYNKLGDFVETPQGYFSVPQFWGYFTFSNGETALVPETFYSYGRVLPENVIKWEYDKLNK
jgi:hypothetical protein